MGIKYIGYYTTPDISPKRNAPLAGRNKMNYTIDVLSDVFGVVEILSPVNVIKGEKGTAGQIIDIKENVTLRLFRNFTNCNRLLARINFSLSRWLLLIHLLLHTNRDTVVLAYHSLALVRILKIAHKIKKFKLILEVNEIYSDVTPDVEKQRSKELSIIKQADAYLFPNDLMSDKLNENNKPYAVQYGILTPVAKLCEKRDDGKIHVVYAGTLDPAKGGAVAAASAAAHLPANYHLHILGFGSPRMVKNIKDIVNEINSKSASTLSYDGTLDGEDFTRFLQSCHIGLSTQNPDAKFNATSFPSKILTYLANGLQVVSIDIPAISQSAMSSDIYLYSNQSAKEIADAILSVNDFNPKSDLLNRLDRSFRAQLAEIREKL